MFIGSRFPAQRGGPLQPGWPPKARLANSAAALAATNEGSKVSGLSEDLLRDNVVKPRGSAGTSSSKAAFTISKKSGLAAFSLRRRRCVSGCCDVRLTSTTVCRILFL